MPRKSKSMFSAPAVVSGLTPRIFGGPRISHTYSTSALQNELGAVFFHYSGRGSVEFGAF